MQQSLFGFEDPNYDPTIELARRFPLEHNAWVDHLPGWLEGHDTVFRGLQQEAVWTRQRRPMYDRTVDVPRLLATPPEAGDLKDLLADLAEALSHHYDADLRSVSLVWYRDGRDSVAFHGDKVGRNLDDCVIAIVSLGTPRRFLLKPVSGGPSMAFSLGWGDLLAMGGSCQRTWQHGVPKVKHAQPRMSIVFRPSKSA